MLWRRALDLVDSIRVSELYPEGTRNTLPCITGHPVCLGHQYGLPGLSLKSSTTIRDYILLHETQGQTVHEMQSQTVHKTQGQTVHETQGQTVRETHGRTVHETQSQTVHETQGQTVHKTLEINSEPIESLIETSKSEIIEDQEMIKSSELQAVNSHKRSVPFSEDHIDLSENETENVREHYPIDPNDRSSDQRIDELVYNGAVLDILNHISKHCPHSRINKKVKKKKVREKTK